MLAIGDPAHEPKHDNKVQPESTDFDQPDLFHVPMENSEYRILLLGVHHQLTIGVRSYLSRAIFKNNSYRAFISIKLSPPNFSISAAATSKATTFSMITLAAGTAHTSLRS